MRRESICVRIRDQIGSLQSLWGCPGLLCLPMIRITQRLHLLRICVVRRVCYGSVADTRLRDASPLPWRNKDPADLRLPTARECPASSRRRKARDRIIQSQLSAAPALSSFRCNNFTMSLRRSIRASQISSCLCQSRRSGARSVAAAAESSNAQRRWQSVRQQPGSDQYDQLEVN